MGSIRENFMILAIVSLTSFTISFGGSSLNLAIPIMQIDLQADSSTMSWFVTIYILATAMFQIPFAKLSDIFDRKIIYLLGLFIFSISCIMVVLTKNISLLLILRFLQGFGGALIFATGTAILANTFSPEIKGKVFGINISSVYFGLTTGPVIGGLIVSFFSWKGIFVVTASLGALSLILLLIKVDIRQERISNEKFDYLGALFYTLTLFTLLYGFRILPNNVGYILIGGSVLFSIFFIFWETRVTSPLIQLSIFKNNRFFTFANLTSITYYTSVTAIAFLINLFLQNVKNFSPQFVGFILLTRPLSQALVSPFGGLLSDKIEHRILTTIGTILGAIGLFIFIFLNANTPLYLILLSLVIGGVGFGLFSSPNTNSIMSGVERKYYNTASALIGTMRTIGQTMSMGIVTITFSVLIGKEQVGSNIYNEKLIYSINTLFTIFLGICLVSSIFSYLRGKQLTKTGIE
ncbi:MAG: MFS transporter [Candidatus Heimdallarchaeum aukensis]|uniref:MFS transporter n=1 Tax=Candidatus Heimdallarchaeum aukensis TaxID=2876573 RepID=A0A9Y1BKC1_9ARCH|nr:MAG: MFS transporter [Candidatus Heimdallarchaeum aukensis]